MRPIIFRGKRVDNGEWVYGYYSRQDDNHLIQITAHGPIGFCIRVIPKTVGQYTGLTDKNGKKIFEGDIVKTKYGRLCIVVWFFSPTHNGWDLNPVNTVENCIRTKCPDAYDLYKEENLEVIGNIHDNELLEEQK